jgi:hypothetical protein
MSASDSDGDAESERDPAPGTRRGDPPAARGHEADRGADAGGRESGQVIALPQRHRLAALGDDERAREGRRDRPDRPPASISFLHEPRTPREDSPEDGEE